MINKQAQLPKGWLIGNLEELCEMYQPKTISRKEMVDDGEFPVYAANGIIGRYDKYNHEKAELLITCRGATCGSVNISQPKSWINGNAMVIKPKKGVKRELLEYMFRGYVDLSKIITGAAQPQITRRSLNPVKISYPESLDEQQRIIYLLDRCFEANAKAKANAEQNLQNAKEVFESYLQGVFEKKGDGWEKKHLSDIALEFGRGKSKHRPRNWEGLFDGSYPFIQTGDVRNSRKYITQYSQTYNEVGLAQSKLWKKGTICITIAANIAETAILDFDACFPDSIIGLQVDPKKADLDFTYYLLQYFKVELQKLGKGSAQDNINLGTFQNKSFPFPKSIKQQKDIVHHLDVLHDETQKLQTHYQKRIDDLEELKQSILQKAFAGELKTEKMVEELEEVQL